MHRKYDVILFDMDGTIADTDPMLLATMNILYDKFRGGVRTPKEQVAYFSGPPIRGTLHKEFPDLDEDFIFNQFYETSKDLYYTHVFPYEHCREVLLELKKEGFKLGVVTNKIHDLAEVTLKVIHLEDLMDCLIAFDDVEKIKPDKEGIVKAIEALGGSLDRTLYIGDNEVDLLTAQDANVDSALVYWGPRVLSDKLKPTYKLNSYLDLKEKLYE